VLRSDFGQSQIWSGVKQSAQPCLYINRSRAILVPLPPLDEQRAIVAKVQELVTLCDHLGLRQQRRAEARILVNDAALDRLVTASNAAEFATAWQRVRDNFEVLYAVPESVAKLRQAILRLAVDGKLVSQDPKEEPAEKLVKRIRQEKAELIRQKRIKD